MVLDAIVAALVALAFVLAVTFGRRALALAERFVVAVETGGAAYRRAVRAVEIGARAVDHCADELGRIAEAAGAPAVYDEPDAPEPEAPPPPIPPILLEAPGDEDPLDWRAWVHEQWYLHHRTPGKVDHDFIERMQKLLPVGGN